VTPPVAPQGARKGGTGSAALRPCRHHPAGGGGVQSTPWHTPRPADDDSQGGLAGRRVLPSSPSRGLCRSLPLLAVTVASPPCQFLGAALGAALGCLPRPESACHGARDGSACVCPLTFLAPSWNSSQCNAAGLLRQGLALRCAPAGCAWDWRVGGPQQQRQVVLVAGAARARAGV
jgi:hypothetical protein